HFLNVAAQDDFLTAATLNKRQRGCGFGADDATERTTILCLDVVSDKSRFDDSVWIEDCGQKIRGSFICESCEVWADGVALTAKKMAGGASIGEDGCSFGAVARQCGRASIFGQDIGMAARLAFPNRLGALLKVVV